VALNFKYQSQIKLQKEEQSAVLMSAV